MREADKHCSLMRVSDVGEALRHDVDHVLVVYIAVLNPRQIHHFLWGIGELPTAVRSKLGASATSTSIFGILSPIITITCP